jgi:hypothetical protein
MGAAGYGIVDNLNNVILLSFSISWASLEVAIEKKLTFQPSIFK